MVHYLERRKGQMKVTDIQPIRNALYYLLWTDQIAGFVAWVVWILWACAPDTWELSGRLMFWISIPCLVLRMAGFKWWTRNWR